jgi:hypothetical protein
MNSLVLMEGIEECVKTGHERVMIAHALRRANEVADDAIVNSHTTAIREATECHAHSRRPGRSSW